MKRLITLFFLVPQLVFASPGLKFCSVSEDSNWEFLKDVQEKYIIAGNLLIFIDNWESRGKDGKKSFTYEPFHCNPDHSANLEFDDLDPYANDRDGVSLIGGLLSDSYILTGGQSFTNRIELSQWDLCQGEEFGLYAKPNGCSGVPDYTRHYQEACNTHDVCFMMLAGSNKPMGPDMGARRFTTFSDQFQACKERFKKDLFEGCLKKYGNETICNLSYVVNNYPEGASGIGASFEKNFMLAQFDQFDYLYEARENLKVAAETNAEASYRLQDLDQKLMNWCQVLKTEQMKIQQEESDFFENSTDGELYRGFLIASAKCQKLGPNSTAPLIEVENNLFSYLPYKYRLQFWI